MLVTQCRWRSVYTTRDKIYAFFFLSTWAVFIHEYITNYIITINMCVCVCVYVCVCVCETERERDYIFFGVVEFFDFRIKKNVLCAFPLCSVWSKIE